MYFRMPAFTSAAGVFFRFFRKKCVVNILGAEPPDPADDHSARMLVPFQYRTWPDTELLANRGRNGDLALRRHL